MRRLALIVALSVGCLGVGDGRDAIGGAVGADGGGLVPSAPGSGVPSTGGDLFGNGEGVPLSRPGLPAGPSGARRYGTGGALPLPPGVGPATAGRCTAPTLDPDAIRELVPEANLEQRLFGTTPVDVAVREPEPCP